MTAKYIVLDLPTFMDKKGELTVLDGLLPFEVKRIYWIYDSDNSLRGGHRHLENRQALVAVKGRIDIFLNDGISHKTILLDSPNKCLIVEPNYWHTMRFGEGAILLVLASHQYDPNDYIDDEYEKI